MAAVTDLPRLPKGRDLSAVESYLERQVYLYNPTWALLSSATGLGGSHYWNGDRYLLDQVIT